MLLALAYGLQAEVMHLPWKAWHWLHNEALMGLHMADRHVADVDEHAAGVQRLAVGQEVLQHQGQPALGVPVRMPHHEDSQDIMAMVHCPADAELPWLMHTLQHCRFAWNASNALQHSEDHSGGTGKSSRDIEGQERT